MDSPNYARKVRSRPPPPKLCVSMFDLFSSFPSVQVFIAIVQRRAFDFLLLSRRSRFRAGTRYKTRGVDATGSVANYVETEQRICLDKNWLSFVQTRGSIPLLWGQSGVKYTPVPRLSTDKDSTVCCEAAFLTTACSSFVL